MNLWLLVITYLIVINGLTFAVWGADKHYAINGMRRVPEKRLLQLCAFGGWPGAIAGAHVFRHKTSKTAFIHKLWFTVAAQVIVLCAAIIMLPH